MGNSLENLWMPDIYKIGIQKGQNKTFIIYQHADGKRENISYNEILLESDKLIQKIKNSGLKKGDRVAVIATLRPFWYSLTYACLRTGLIMVCIDPGVPVEQTKNMLKQTDVKAVFTSTKKVYLPDELSEHIPIYSIDRNFPLLSKCQKVDILLGDSKPFPEDTFFVLFSSGTTGENRKAVLLKHSTVTMGIEYGISTNAGIYKDKPAYGVHKCDLMLFPPYHIAGLLCATYDLFCNTQVIILERLTPNALMMAFNELKPDNICTVPSMLSSLYKKIVSSYSSKPLLKFYVNTSLKIASFLRKNFGIKAGRFLLKKINTQAFGGNMQSFMIGASPFDTVTNKFFLDIGIDVSMAYGLTELGAPLAVTGEGYYPGTTGRVLKHTDLIDIRIVNPDENGKGEVEVRSPYQMISYLDPKDNEGCFTDDGYFKTGDLGYFDENKCLVICGRAKETIVLRNGEKLLPEEIEQKYQGLDSVAEVVAFKIPGSDNCDEFAIAITKSYKGMPDEPMRDRVLERAQNLPAMYRPKDVFIVKEFPLSSSHKVQRFRLTEMALNGESEPTTEASMIPIDEDETTTELRKMLIEVGGPQWKNIELTQGLYLDIDSLSMVNLFVMIQEKWDIDLFQTSIQPETFGELLDTIKNFDVVDKKEEEKIDLSKYPLPSSAINRLAVGTVSTAAKITFNVKGTGMEKLPKDTSYILCSNHRTVIDPSFIISCLPKEVRKKTCVIGKAELVNDKLLRNFTIAYNFIPLDRTGNSIETLNRSREVLNEGYNILIFPEGTNVENNTKLYPLKDGAAKLSIATQKPIIPVHITGVAHVKKEINNFKLPPLNSKIRVKFGEPIYPGYMNAEELNDLLAHKIQELD